MEENNKKEPGLMPERDVLGQEKPAAVNNAAAPAAKPGRIFIVLAVIVVIAVVYWLATGR